ncbi:DUF3180 domain-containing protein [Corynebacterium aquatimens]|nr:DUF3180 domain-containing protein [Corynebacterium aquatimens]
MSRTSITALIAVAGFFAAAALILLRRFYGVLNTVTFMYSLPLWFMAVLCVFLAFVVKRRREQGRVGLDRSQLNPMMVANYLATAQACAWAGAIFGGLYVGLLVWIVPKISSLDAAGADLPGAIAGAVGAVALTAAALFLEKSCEVTPPTEGEPTA